MNPETCNVCERERETMVVGSGLGPMSIAYCGECGCRYAEPEWMFRMTFEDTGGDVADWVRQQVCTYRNGEYLSWDEWLTASGIAARSDETPLGGSAEDKSPQDAQTSSGDPS